MESKLEIEAKKVSFPAKECGDETGCRLCRTPYALADAIYRNAERYFKKLESADGAASDILRQRDINRNMAVSEYLSVSIAKVMGAYRAETVEELLNMRLLAIYLRKGISAFYDAMIDMRR